MSIIKPNEKGMYFVPIKFFNIKNGQPVTISMHVDTGFYFTTIGAQYAKSLGIDDIESGEQIKTSDKITTYAHILKMQIGDLKSVRVKVYISTTPISINYLAWPDFLRNFKLSISAEEGLTIENLISVVVPFAEKGVERPIHDIIIYNMKTGKPVTVPIMVDTGAAETYLDNKYQRLLGVDTALKTETRLTRTISDLYSGKLGTVTYGYKMKVLISPKLKPITIPVYFRDLANNNIPNFLGLGRLTKLQPTYNVSFEKDKVRYEEIFYGTTGVSNSATNYRKRYI